MLYTSAEPKMQGDRIRLFPSLSAYRSAFGSSPVHAVAVRFDPDGRRLFPLWTDPATFDPQWSTPAQFHADGSVTARAPVPQALFVPCGARSQMALA